MVAVLATDDSGEEGCVSLPKLMDCRAIMLEMGVKRTAAEAIIRACPKVEIDGVRKVYVRQSDVERYLAERTKAA